MKAATKGDKPAWLTPPAGIVTAEVCRLSGKLASQGCEGVEVVGENGRLEHRSMVYREFFSRGTEPTELCDLHASRGFLGAVASLLLGSHEKPTPPHVEELPPAPAAAYVVVDAEPPGVEPAEAPKKKRGFWSRVFGIGRGKDKAPKEDKR